LIDGMKNKHTKKHTPLEQIQYIIENRRNGKKIVTSNI